MGGRQGSGDTPVLRIYRNRDSDPGKGDESGGDRGLAQANTSSSRRHFIAYNITVTVTVLLFASLAEQAGTRRLEIPCDAGDTVVEIKQKLLAECPGISSALGTVLFALNEEYVKSNAPVKAGDTLALIPPVSGG